LGGVIHAAGFLDDALLLQQDWERFAAVLAPKTGARNLHLLTRSHRLDFFILFSSIASVLGSPGQASYCSGNAFLDALAHHRMIMGLSATSVNWGPWTMSGMASRVGASSRDQWALRGIQTISPQRGLRLLGHVLEEAKGQIVALPVDWAKFFSQVQAVPSLLSEISGHFKKEEGANGSSSLSQFVDDLRHAPRRKRRAMLTSHITDQVRRVLGLNSADGLDVRQGLSSLGMDSLMAVELRSRLQSSLGCSLPATIAFEYPNIEAISDYIATDVLLLKVSPEDPRQSSAPKPRIFWRSGCRNWRSPHELRRAE
jgi:acyl carrier protein